MLYFRTGLAAVAITVASASNSASGEDSCQNIIAWDCGSGAAIELPSKLHDVVAIDAGDIFSVALRSNGQVVVWGNAPADPVEVGGTSYQPYLIPRHIQFQTSAIAAGQEHGLALTSIGKLKRWHQDYTPSHNGIFPGHYTDAIDIAGGGSGPIQDLWWGQSHYPFFLVLHEAGTITVFGDNVPGTQGIPQFSIQSLPENLGTVRAVAAGENHALALNAQGSVIAWGSNDHDQAAIPEGLQSGTAVAIAAGKNHSLAVNSDGTVFAWGLNDQGQCDVPEGLTDVAAVAGGEGHSIAVRSDGTVVAWGSNEFGQCDVPANLGVVREIACGRWHSLVLCSGGTIAAWGDDRYAQSSVNPTTIEDLSNVIGLAVGDEHRLALKADGEVVAWGGNESGQANVPPTLAESSALAAGERHSLALETSGSVVAWGDNTFGQCDVPAELVGAIAITAGNQHSLALLSGGTVVAWGANDANQCDVPPGLTDVIAIAAGESHSMALRFNGTVEVWGSNEYGQTQLPENLQNIRAIGSGGDHCLAVRNDGFLFAWGSNEKHQCDIPQNLPSAVSVQGGTNYSIIRTADGRVIAWGECGERMPGPIQQNEPYYSATFPYDIEDHALFAAGFTDIIAIKDMCPPCSPADFNRDNVVNEIDLLFLYQVLGQACVGGNSDACAADLNHDGGVGLDDLAMLLRYWGPCGATKFSVPAMGPDGRR